MKKIVVVIGVLILMYPVGYVGVRIFHILVRSPSEYDVSGIPIGSSNELYPGYDGFKKFGGIIIWYVFFPCHLLETKIRNGFHMH